LQHQFTVPAGRRALESGLAYLFRQLEDFIRRVFYDNFRSAAYAAAACAAASAWAARFARIFAQALCAAPAGASLVLRGLFHRVVTCDWL
jgi:hypothetical protein